MQKDLHCLHELYTERALSKGTYARSRVGTVKRKEGEGGESETKRFLQRVIELDWACMHVSAVRAYTERWASQGGRAAIY